MKLHLSSFRLGEHPEEMRCADAKNNRVAVIQNARDCWTDSSKRKAAVKRECDHLKLLGLEPQEFGLRQVFGRSEAMRKEISSLANCWVCGGDCCVLRRAYRLSDFDLLISELAEEEAGFVCGGYSAGACVISPTLEGIHLPDDPDSHPGGYGTEVLWDGVGCSTIRL